MQTELVEELHKVLRVVECKPVARQSQTNVDVGLVCGISLLAGLLSFGHLGYYYGAAAEKGGEPNEALVAYASVHGSVLVLFSFLMGWFGRWLNALPMKSRAKSVREMLHKYSKSATASLQPVDSKFATPTKRHGQWVYVANNFIQRGDLVALQSGKRAPAKVARQFDQLVIERDEVLPVKCSSAATMSSMEGNLLNLLDVEEYLVLESPLVDDIGQFLMESNVAQEVEFNQQLLTLIIHFRLAAVSGAVVFAILIGGLAHERSESDWFLVFLMRPVGLLCLLPSLTWPLFRFAIEFYWMRRMMAICGEGSRQASPFLPSTLLHVMGTVTTLCNLDEETLLHGSIVEEIFVLTTKEYKVLDCCLDGGENALRFEDPHWRQHMDVLKPIGLTCSLLDQRPQITALEEIPLAKMFLKEDGDPLRHFTQLALAMGLSNKQSFQVHSRLIFVEDEPRCFLKKKKRQFECLLVSPTLASTLTSHMQMLCFGDSSLLLQFCPEYWNGEAIAPLEGEFRNQTEAMIKQWGKEDLTPTAFAYSPIPTPSAGELDSPVHCRYVVLGSDVGTGTQDGLVGLVCEALARGQIFTGMSGSPDLPKLEIASLVETLWSCGIRFVYFSPRDTRKTRKIAEKMGLDTDWNTSISLSSLQDEATASEVAVAWELKARLPRGLAAIRAHIQSVDDVPLRVSVFTEASPDTTSGMIQIMREWGEVAAVYGSPLSGGNVKAFLRANACVGIIPRSPGLDEDGATAMDFAKLPCSFTLYEDQIPLLLSLLGEGRVALYNYRQANQALLAVCLVAFAGQCAVFCASNTEMFSLGHVLWLSLAAIPLMSSSPALRLRSKQDMLRRRMPWKKTAVPNLPNPYRRYLVYALVRLLPCVAFVFGIFFWALNVAVAEAAVADQGTTTWTWDAAQASPELVAAQSMALLAFVWCANLVAGTFASRTKFTVEWSFGLIWAPITFGTIGLQLVYNCLFAQFMVGSCPIAFPSNLALWLVVTLAPPIFVPLVTLPVKRHDATFDLRAMRMLRLDFETKLGQFSPK
ncbi:hypothetical protein BASA81_004458 [Batrachochytrium salamandrivorans]|nr:hypothetical protein BASA81_004458 [Batrachochytrium salamandrivorans]